MMNGLKGRGSLGLSLLALAALVVVALVWKPWGRASTQDGLVVFCEIDHKKPLEAIAQEYEKAYGVPIQVKSGASQALLANLAVSPRADLFLPKDDSYLLLARKKKLVLEMIPLAQVQVVLAVKKGNPEGITSLDALILLPGLRIAMADPERTQVGKITLAALERTGKWEKLKRRNLSLRPLMNSIANDLATGSLDAGFIWNSMVPNYPELEVVSLPAMANAHGRVALGVLRKSKQPAEALRFARYVTARDKGLLKLAEGTVLPLRGDDWAEVPEVVLYGGAINRVAVEKTIKQFAEREGVRITRLYDEDANLVRRIKASRQPDAYLVSDKSLLESVGDQFLPPSTDIAGCDIVLLTAKGNPKQLKALADLAKPGLRLGLVDPDQGTLGAFTRRLLAQTGVRIAVMSNVVSQTATVDPLISQMRGGALDAALVFSSQALKVTNTLEALPLSEPGSTLVQSFSIGKNTRHRHLMQRLAETLRSEESRARYQAAGFNWREAPPVGTAALTR